MGKQAIFSAPVLVVGMKAVLYGCEDEKWHRSLERRPTFSIWLLKVAKPLTCSETKTGAGIAFWAAYSAETLLKGSRKWRVLLWPVSVSILMEM